MTAEPDEYKRDYADLPGMKAALETLKPEYWEAKQKAEPPKSKFMGLPVVDALKGLARKINEMTFPVDVVLNIALNNPAALASALPFVRNLRLNRALGELATIPEGQDLIDTIKPGLKVELNGDPRFTGGVNKAMPDFENGMVRMTPLGIEVEAYAPQGYITGVLAHELRHQHQMETGMWSPYMSGIPSPIEAVWYNRMIEADASATAADVAWKLKEAGKPDAWACKGGFGPAIGHAYEEVVKNDPSAAYDGRAQRAAFDAWFAEDCGRSKVYNQQGVNNAPNTYSMDKLAQGGMPLHHIKVSDVEKLGEAPGGGNYLKIPGARPLDDPYYRAPDWNKEQAERLARLHDKYDDLKKNGGSKIAAQGDAPNENANKGQAQVSLARPTAYRARPGMKL